MFGFGGLVDHEPHDLGAKGLRLGLKTDRATRRPGKPQQSHSDLLRLESSTGYLHFLYI